MKKTRSDGSGKPKVQKIRKPQISYEIRGFILILNT